MVKERPAKEKRKTDSFTTTEVGAMLEAIDTSIKAIAEGHSGLDKRMEKLEVAVNGNSHRLDFLEVRFDVVEGKVSRLEDASLKLLKDLRETGEKLETKIAKLGTELKTEIRNLGNRLTAVESSRS